MGTSLNILSSFFLKGLLFMHTTMQPSLMKTGNPFKRLGEATSAMTQTKSGGLELASTLSTIQQVKLGHPCNSSFSSSLIIYWGMEVNMFPSTRRSAMHIQFRAPWHHGPPRKHIWRKRRRLPVVSG